MLQSLRPTTVRRHLSVAAMYRRSDGIVDFDPSPTRILTSCSPRSSRRLSVTGPDLGAHVHSHLDGLPGASPSANETGCTAGETRGKTSSVR